MAKKKSTKKEVLNEEVLEKEVVSFEDTKVNEIEESITDIEPIDMTEELEELKKEIFDEPIKEEKVVKEELNKNKVKTTLKNMFGFVWNGMEYDNYE